MKVETTEISAGQLSEMITKQISREFKCSRPRPRNKAMGFYGKDFEITPKNSRRQKQ